MLLIRCLIYDPDYVMAFHHLVLSATPVLVCLLLGMSQTDLREHALFALRNLLHENVENQAVVDAIKPMGTWDENGVLRDAPGVRK